MNQQGTELLSANLFLFNNYLNLSFNSMLLFDTDTQLPFGLYCERGVIHKLRVMNVKSNIKIYLRFTVQNEVAYSLVHDTDTN